MGIISIGKTWSGWSWSEKPWAEWFNSVPMLLAMWLPGRRDFHTAVSSDGKESLARIFQTLSKVIISRVNGMGSTSSPKAVIMLVWAWVIYQTVKYLEYFLMCRTSNTLFFCHFCSSDSSGEVIFINPLFVILISVALRFWDRVDWPCIQQVWKYME
jgi:hypothetical protein